jgi:hypothetical protein
MRSRFLLCSVLIVSLATPSLVWAAPKKPKGGGGGTTEPAVEKDPKKAEAAKLKREADQLMGQDRYADALALYKKAHDISADPALLYNQGRALEAMGEYPDAIDMLEKFDKEASPALHAKVPALRELINDLKSRIATLIVTSNVADARLLVREKAQGTVADGEKKTIRMRAGPASVEVSADGYNTFKKDVDLTAGNTVKIDAQLTLKKSDAVLVIRSKPISDISVDGKSIGRVPLEFHIAAGSHNLVAEASGYEAENVPMTLALGDRRELDIELHKSPSITSRWWFWTAIGGVVAAGAAVGGYILITTERTPDGGDFGKGTVTAPR